MAASIFSSLPLGLSSEEQIYYSALFRSADIGQKGRLTGPEAVQLLKRSKLADSTLSVIWQKSDSENLGYLSPLSFARAMRLISLAQNQRPLDIPSLIDKSAHPLPRIEGMEPLSAADSFSGLTGGLKPTANDSNRTLNLGVPNSLQSSPWQQQQQPLGDLSGALQRTPSAISTLPDLVPATQTAAFQSILSTITVDEKQRYSDLFQPSARNGLLDGNSARMIFLKSNLPSDILAQIWNLADTQRRGALNNAEFVLAMVLIQRKLSGQLTTIPTAVPPSLVASLSNNVLLSTQESMVPVAFGKSGPIAASYQKTFTPEASVEWKLTAEDRSKSEAYFNSLDVKKQSFLTGAEAAPFFIKSSLSESILADIWRLADYDNNGKLDRHEFAVGMLLVQKCLAGAKLPSTLPPTLRYSSVEHLVTASAFGGSNSISNLKSSGSQVNLQNTPTLPRSAPPVIPIGPEHSSVIKDLQNQYQATLVDSNNLNTKFTQLKSDMDSLQKEKDELQQKIKTNRDRIDGERKKFTDLQQSWQNIQREITQMKAQLQQEQTELETAKVKTVDGQKWLDELKTDHEKVEKELQRAKDECRQIQLKFEADKTAYLELNRNMEQNREQVNQLRAEAANIRKEAESMASPPKTAATPFLQSPSHPFSAEFSNISSAPAKIGKTKNNSANNIDDLFGSAVQQSIFSQTPLSDSAAIGKKANDYANQKAKDQFTAPVNSGRFPSGRLTSIANVAPTPSDNITSFSVTSSPAKSGFDINAFETKFPTINDFEDTFAAAQATKKEELAPVTSTPAISQAKSSTILKKKLSEFDDFDAEFSSLSVQKDAAAPVAAVPIHVTDADFEDSFNTNPFEQPAIVNVPSQEVPSSSSLSSPPPKPPRSQTPSVAGSTASSPTSPVRNPFSSKVASAAHSDFAPSSGFAFPVNFDNTPAAEDPFSNEISTQPKAEAAAAVEWDSIFGAPAIPASNDQNQNNAAVFDSAFPVTFDDAFSPSQASSPENTISHFDSNNRSSVYDTASLDTSQKYGSNSDVANIVQMGFSKDKAEDALKKTNGNLQQAINLLLDSGNALKSPPVSVTVANGTKSSEKPPDYESILKETANGATKLASHQREASDGSGSVNMSTGKSKWWKKK